jgi:hypothetical protein
MEGLKMGKEALVCFIVCVLVVSSIFAGCATVRKNESRGTEDLLIAAGFTRKVATTTEGQAKLNALKPLKMVRAKKDGEVIYVYPDPYNCKCAYVGGEQQYAEYKRLVRLQQMGGQQMGEEDPGPFEWMEDPMDPGSWLR